ncbi:MAG: family 16 glycoside hydrolase [Chloroflexales bacterium]
MKRSKNRPLIVSLLVGTLVVAGVGLALIQTSQGAAQSQGALVKYPDYPPTPTIGPNPTLPPQLAGASAILAQSDFADASALRNWEFVDQSFVIAGAEGQWAVKDGRLAQNYAGLTHDLSTQEVAAITGDPAWHDYTVQVSFYDEFNGTAGVMAHYTGSDPTTASYYRIRALTSTFSATPKLILERVDQGVARALVEINGPGFTSRIWHTLGLTVHGGSLQATLDGQVVAEATDSAPLSAGRAGIYTRASGGILFDDFVVTTP